MGTQSSKRKREEWEGTWQAGLTQEQEAQFLVWLSMRFSFSLLGPVARLSGSRAPAIVCSVSDKLIHRRALGSKI